MAEIIADRISTTLMSIVRIVAFEVGFFLISCHQQIRFDKFKWKQHEDAGQPSSSRQYMLDDLIGTYKLKEMTYSQIFSLLGQPDFKDDSVFGYDVVVEYGSDIDPVHTKTLDFTMSKDSVMTACKISEWEKIISRQNFAADFIHPAIRPSLWSK